MAVTPACKSLPPLLPVSALDAAQRGAMRDLLDRHFHGVCAEAFHADLAWKTHALLLTDADGRLIGFSTLRYRRADDCGVVWSGDTVVDPCAWHSPRLAQAWVRGVLALHADAGTPLWWQLICSGVRTYRFLPVFLREFWPRHDQVTPPATQNLRDRLAAQAYGAAFNPPTGIVRLSAPQRLRPHLEDQPSRANDPHAAFFAAANPGAEYGDELACLTELSWANLNAAGRRMAGGPP